MRKGATWISDTPRIQTWQSLLASGISDLLAGRSCAFLDILSDLHRRGLNLLGLALDLMTCVTGKVTIGRFKLAFDFFGSGITFV